MSDTQLDSALRALAAVQYHVVSRAQARRTLGANYRKLDRRVRAGDWEWVTPRVLRLVGTRTSFHQLCMIAVLHTGGVICGVTTLALCEIAGFGRRTPIHIAVGRDGARGVPDWIQVHQTRFLPAHHTMKINGVPSVTPTRALYDIAHDHDWERVKRALRNAWRKKLTSGAHLHYMGPEWFKRGRTGTVAMRHLLTVTPDEYKVPNTNLEDRLFSILEDAGFPRLKREVDMGSDSRWIGRVDGKDPELPLVAEVDSETFHFEPIDGDNDAARDEAFGQVGVEVVRFTEHEVWHEPRVVVERWREARDRIRRANPPA